jgi:hypothetical protein
MTTRKANHLPVQCSNKYSIMFLRESPQFRLHKTCCIGITELTEKPGEYPGIAGACRPYDHILRPRRISHSNTSYSIFISFSMILPSTWR